MGTQTVPHAEDIHVVLEHAEARCVAAALRMALTVAPWSTETRETLLSLSMFISDNLPSPEHNAVDVIMDRTAA